MQGRVRVGIFIVALGSYDVDVCILNACYVQCYWPYLGPLLQYIFSIQYSATSIHYFRLSLSVCDSCKAAIFERIRHVDSVTSILTANTFCDTA